MKNRLIHNARAGLPDNRYASNDHAERVQSDQIKGLLANMISDIPSPLP